MADSKWIVAGNCQIPGLTGLAEVHRLGRVYLYTRGLSGNLPGRPPFEIDVRTITTVAVPAGPLPDRVPVTAPARVRLDEHRVTVQTAVRNEDAVYAAWNRTRGRFAYFTDLFLAPLILPALGLPVLVHDYDDPDAGGTMLRHVHRLPFGTVQDSQRRRSGWTVRTSQCDDPLPRLCRSRWSDPFAAGEAQVAAIRAEIRAIARDRPGTRFATLLSGGIDSGTVTLLAADEAVPVTAYSAGTPWGDEFDDAAELCEHAGLALTRVALSMQRILAAIPRTIRFLAVSSPEVVEIALTATALYSGPELLPGGVVLTGYGSDLINAGLYHSFDDPAELTDQTIGAVHRTRFTNELCGRLPLAHGHDVHHPFWSWPATRVALGTAPECKVRDGREKYHLRLAMSGHLPKPLAWRRKQAVHHGSGLQAGLAKLLAADAPGVPRETIYRACVKELIRLAADGVLDDWDPIALYHRSLATAAAA